MAIGGGSSSGAHRMARSLVDDGATALISFGLAGGLDPSLSPGALVVPSTVLSNGQIYVCDPALSEALGGMPIRSLLAVGTAVATAAEKQRLWRDHGAAAVDMESGAVAEVASAAGVPFAVIRAICDPADRDLPVSAVQALDLQGRIAFGTMARIVLRNPRELLGLATLGRDAARARRSLVRGAESLRRLAARDANLGGLAL